MFASLLVGVDGSKGASHALDTAIALGRHFKSTIVVAAVVDLRVLEAPLIESAGSGWPPAIAGTPTASLDLGEIMTSRADKLLSDAAARVRGEGLTVVTSRAVGMVDDELLAMSDAAEALVVGRRGEIQPGPGLGATTVRLVRRSPRPVVVAGEHPSAFEHPVVAYDGSDTAGAALALAARYAEAAGVQLDIVHVTEGDGHELLARTEAFMSQHTDVRYATHELAGDAVDAIAAHVARSGGDMLVCGAHRSAPGRRRSWGIGSTAESLLEATTVPIVVVR